MLGPWKMLYDGASNFSFSEFRIDDASRIFYNLDTKQAIIASMVAGSTGYAIYKCIRYFQQDVRKLKGPVSLQVGGLRFKLPPKARELTTSTKFLAIVGSFVNFRTRAYNLARRGQRCVHRLGGEIWTGFEVKSGVWT